MSHAFSFAVVTLICAGGLSAASFTYTTLAVPDSLDLTTIPSGINDEGQIVGSFQDKSGTFHGFMRSADGTTYTTIDVPGSMYTTALAINNQGEVVGLFAVPFGTPAVYIRSSDGTSFTMPALLGRPVSIYGLGLNNNSQVVGYYQENNRFSSFLCDLASNSCTPLALSGAAVTAAKAINDQGQVTGYVNVAGQVRGFLLNPDGTTLVFDEPDATTSTIATGISSNGQITGYFSGSTGPHNFLRTWDGSTFVSFDDPSVGAGSSYATGVNNLSQVVGYSLPSFDHYQGFMGASPVPAHATSDDFTGSSLNSSLWNFIDPKGDGGYGMNGSELLLTVPAGSNHDSSQGGGDNAARVVQSVQNLDFIIEAKFDSIPALPSQTEGLLVDQDISNFLSFQLQSTGDSVVAGVSRVSSKTKTDLASVTISIPAGTTSLWLRVQRAGDTWTETWSVDGSAYNTAASFTQVLTVADVGLFSGNYNAADGAQPSFTASVDYFMGQPVP